MSLKILRLPANHFGRDFVVGDIHFKTIDLHRGLHALGFDKAKDRVIAVGDVMDRGPGVLDGLKLLGEPWFFSVQGNHEQMLIAAYRENPSARYASHGAGWWLTIADESKSMIIDKLSSLPLAIEIETENGIVGSYTRTCRQEWHGPRSWQSLITKPLRTWRFGAESGSRSTIETACRMPGECAQATLGCPAH